MGLQFQSENIPSADSPLLGLRHPTKKECLRIWRLASLSWRDSLDENQFLEESAYLLTIPLAKDGGMTLTLVSNPGGSASDKNLHGIASVFTDPEYRRRGYGRRMMRELSLELRNFHFDRETNVGAVLYSDIGKQYYAALGWQPFPNNGHVEFSASNPPAPVSTATELYQHDLEALCKLDEETMRNALAKPFTSRNTKICIIPNMNHMLWHHCKEDFAAEKNFGRAAPARGALVGQPGNRMWAIWTRRWYDKPDSPDAHNTLYVLRLVVENEDGDRDAQAEQLKTLIETMQREAHAWKLQDVKVWDPSPLVRDLVEKTGVAHKTIMREEEGIASLQWFGQENATAGSIEWIANEKYAWC
ncbi:hypothetical protein B0T22DRAFT_510863 [Podospora appendiculata]|uniref:N-acetyltransferase domain-containing protein n=1 Tax=Podospora appendiculata TaxID=314037 RepID=A0AAE0X8L9_9PEZI|nr:hypothetical protein B0T22DRAFT_510863 [Podospora appendiculata]